MKNVVKLAVYYSSGRLERAIGFFVERYNRRLHDGCDSACNLDPLIGGIGVQQCPQP
jgi:hypothetical protein